MTLKADFADVVMVTIYDNNGCLNLTYKILDLMRDNGMVSLIPTAIDANEFRGLFSKSDAEKIQKLVNEYKREHLNNLRGIK